MIRKITVAATAAGLAFGGLALMASPAGAAKPTVTHTGTATCSVTGKLKIVPPLTNINTAPSTTAGKLKGVCTGSAQEGVSAAKAKAALSIIGTNPGTCTGLLAPSGPPTPVTVAISWKGTGGKINPSSINFDEGYAVAGINFTLSNGDTSGSYAGTNNASAVGTPDIGALAAALATCDPNEKGKVKGVKKITILSGSLSLT